MLGTEVNDEIANLICGQLLFLEAEDGAQALAALDGDPFQLVISDLRMPKVDGLELLRKARSRPQPPRVILITASPP